MEPVRRSLACSKAVAGARGASTRIDARATDVGIAQSWSPAVADIMGALRACTGEMISSMSMPCR
jgi:hypothetical protein